MLFKYTGMDIEGKEIKGKMKAASEEDCAFRLKQNDLYPINIKLISDKPEDACEAVDQHANDNEIAKLVRIIDEESSQEFERIFMKDGKLTPPKEISIEKLIEEEEKSDKTNRNKLKELLKTAKEVDMIDALNSVGEDDNSILYINMAQDMPRWRNLLNSRFNELLKEAVEDYSMDDIFTGIVNFLEVCDEDNEFWEMAFSTLDKLSQNTRDFHNTRFVIQAMCELLPEDREQAVKDVTDWLQPFCESEDWKIQMSAKKRRNNLLGKPEYEGISFWNKVKAGFSSYRV